MQLSEKIKTIDECRLLKAALVGKTVHLCHGVFDIVHYGHLKHLRKAKLDADVLVVSITADQYVKKKRSFAFDEKVRAVQLSSLELVDFVVIVPSDSALPVIEALQPDVYVKGDEYADLTLDHSKNIYLEKKSVESYGGKLAFTHEETLSSTKIGYFLNAESEADQEKKASRENVAFRDLSYLGYELADFKKILSNVCGMKILVVGETIIDTWTTAQPLGFSSKSRCACVQLGKSNTQLGGAYVMAQHLAVLGADVTLLSNIQPDENVRKKQFKLLSIGDIPSVNKTRFVDPVDGRVMFETQVIPDAKWDLSLPNQEKYDLCYFADFGHGCFKGGEHEYFKNFSNTVVAMAQTNTANQGKNLMRKHSGVDAFFMNTREAELELQAFDEGSALDLAQFIFEKHSRKTSVSVTAGGEKSAFVHVGGSVEVPVVSCLSKDTVGCGDIYFALFAAALFGVSGIEPKLAGVFASVGASYIASDVGNFGSPDPDYFIRAAKIMF